MAEVFPDSLVFQRRIFQGKLLLRLKLFEVLQPRLERLT